MSDPGEQLQITFRPVNELERRLVAAATDPAERPAFYRAVAEYELLVITEGEKPERERRLTLAADRQLRIRTIDVEGSPHTPIFSSSDRISAVVSAQAGFIAIKGRDLLGILRGTDLVLNPGSAYGKVFTAKEVESILDGTIFNLRQTIIGAGQTILLGHPKDYPHRLTEVLSRFFKRSHQVEAAYLAYASIAGQDLAPHPLIGIELSGDWQSVVGEAGMIASDVVGPGEVADFYRLLPDASDSIGSYLRGHTKPFYRRKKFLGLF